MTGDGSEGSSGDGGLFARLRAALTGPFRSDDGEAAERTPGSPDAGDPDDAVPEPTDEGPSLAFEVYELDGWYWRLVDEDGDPLAAATAAADSEATARERIGEVARGVADADVTVVDPPAEGGTEPDAAVDHATPAPDPDPAKTATRVPAVPERGRFELYESPAGWRWQLRDGDDRLVAESGRAYGSVDAADGAIETVGTDVPDAGTLEYAPAGFEVYRATGTGEAATTTGDGTDGSRGGSDGSGERTDGSDGGSDGSRGGSGASAATTGDRWRWRLRHRNDRVLAVSPAGYGDRDDAIAAVEALKGADLDPVPVESGDGWNWELRDGDRPLATGPGPVDGEDAATVAARRATEHLADAGVIVLDPLGFELAETDDGWRFRLRHREGHAVARAGGFDDRQRAVAGLRRFVRMAPEADARVRDRETERVIQEALADAERARSLVDEVAGNADENAESIREILDPGTDADGPDDGPADGIEDAGEDPDRPGEAETGPDRTGEAGEDPDRTGEAGEDPDRTGETGEDPDRTGETGEDPDRTGETGEDPAPETATGGGTAFEVYEAGGDWRVRIVRDGSVVAEGVESHLGRGSAIDAADRVADVVRAAAPVTVDPAAFVVSPGDDGWRYRLVAADGALLAESGDRTRSEDELLAAIRATRDELSEGTELYQDDGWRWRLRVDGRIVARAARGYDSTDAARAARDRVRDLVPDAPVETVEEPTCEVHPADGGWGYRVRDADGRVVLTATGHDDATAAREAFETLSASVAEAPTRIARDDPDEK